MGRILAPTNVVAEIEDEKKVAIQKQMLGIVAPHVGSAGLRATEEDDFVTDEQAQEQVDSMPDRHPIPLGFQVLVLVMTPPEYVGELKLPTEAIEARAMVSPQGVVVALGMDAYQNPERYPNGPWVEIGDRIAFKKYSGGVHKTHTGHRFVAINDDQPLVLLGRCVVEPDKGNNDA